MKHLEPVHEERDEGVRLNFLVIYRILSQRQKNESDIELLVANVLYVTG